MSTIEELEARLRLIEEDRGLRTEVATFRGEMRGQMVDLRHETRADIRNLERDLALMRVVQDSHTLKLGDLHGAVNQVIESVAELRRLFIARGDT